MKEVPLLLVHLVHNETGHMEDPLDIHHLGVPLAHHLGVYMEDIHLQAQGKVQVHPVRSMEGIHPVVEGIPGLAVEDSQEARPVRDILQEGHLGTLRREGSQNIEDLLVVVLVGNYTDQMVVRVVTVMEDCEEMVYQKV